MRTVAPHGGAIYSPYQMCNLWLVECKLCIFLFEMIAVNMNESHSQMVTKLMMKQIAEVYFIISLIYRDDSGPQPEALLFYFAAMHKYSKRGAFPPLHGFSPHMSYFSQKSRIYLLFAVSNTTIVREMMSPEGCWEIGVRCALNLSLCSINDIVVSTDVHSRGQNPV